MGKVAIIGLASSTGPGSGKSYVANTTRVALEASGHRVYILSFAGPVKELAARVADKLWGIALGHYPKDTPIPGMGFFTARHIYRAIGDARRDMNPNCWVDEMWHRIITLNSTNDLVIIVDDVRYKNELEMIVEMGGKVFNVINVTKVKTPFEDSGDLVFDLDTSPSDLSIYNKPYYPSSEIQDKILPVIKTQLEGE